MNELTNVDIARRLGWEEILETTWFEDPVTVGIGPNEAEADLIPDFLHNLNLALSLPLPEGTRLDVAIWATGQCEVNLTGKSNCHGRAIDIDGLAKEICECWWRYKE